MEHRERVEKRAPDLGLGGGLVELSVWFRVE